MFGISNIIFELKQKKLMDCVSFADQLNNRKQKFYGGSDYLWKKLQMNLNFNNLLWLIITFRKCCLVLHAD